MTTGWPLRRAQITTLHPTSYSEARAIGEQFRDGHPVIMNLTELDEPDAKRLVDFAAGLAFGLRGGMERVTNRVFLLSPPNVQVSAEDKARIAESEQHKVAVDQRRKAEERLGQVIKMNLILCSIFQDLEPGRAEKEGRPLTAVFLERVDRAAAEIARDAALRRQHTACRREVDLARGAGLRHRALPRRHVFGCAREEDDAARAHVEPVNGHRFLRVRQEAHAIHQRRPA